MQQPPAVCPVSTHEYDLPVFTDAVHGVLATLGGSGSGTAVMFDTTMDGGKSWHPTQPAPLVIPPSSPLSPSVVAAVASPDAWWVVAATGDGLRVARTSDSGSTWTTTTPHGLPAAPDNLVALGPSVVFAEVAAEQGTGAYTRTVYESTDGGADWGAVR